MADQQWQGMQLHARMGLQGEVLVLQDKSRRWLNFADSPAIQSCMLRNDPAQLVLPYQHTMMMWPLFMTATLKHAVLIGVGGGDMIRYLQQHYPAVSIQAVDEDPVMLQIACNYFSVNPGSMLALQVDTAEQFVQHIQQPQDLLLIDIVANDAMPACLYDNEFWQACQHGLSATGIMIVNVITSSETEFVALLEQLRSVFGHLPVCVSVPEHRNVVLFLSANLDDVPNLDELQARAESLSRQTSLPVESVMDVLKTDNRIKNNRFCLLP